MSDRAVREHGVVPVAAATGFRGALRPVVGALRALGVSPNAVSVTGALLVVAGAALLASGQPWPSLVLLGIGSAADTLDGQLARASGRESTFGEFLDSTLDRVSDAALFAGASALAGRLGHQTLLYLSLWALVASALVPYVRAKAESLGRDATVGLAPREARTAIALIGVALLAITGDPRVLAAASALVALLATVTVAQRIAHVHRQQP